MEAVPNTSDVIIEGLESWGVDTVFGLPGDGINGLMEALRQREGRIRFVLVRHEEAAAFMATAYAKLTGRLGVCIATSGPGAIHLLNGLYDAKLDGAPVLAITGQTYSDLIGSRYQQEVDMVRLFDDVSVYNVGVTSPEHARSVVDLACRAALARRGVAHLNLPIDVQVEPMRGGGSEKNVPGHTRPHEVDLAVRPPAREVERAARLLNEGRRVVLLVGRGAYGAHEELLELARRLQAPIAKALLGKDVLPDAHPHVLGGVGHLGTLPAQRALEGCDTLLMVGTSFPYMEHLPKPGSVRGIQVDSDATRLGLRYPVDVGLVGDARATLQELLPLIEPRATSDWLAGLQGEMRDWRGLMATRAESPEAPIKPQLVAQEVGRRLRDDAIVTCDSGTITTWAARHIDIRQGQRFALSGNLASMAPGLPYAIAAQIAYPERQVVAFIGDGGLLMLASELSVAAHYRLPIKVVVVKNGSLGMIKWEQLVFLGNPSYGVELPPVDLAMVARGLGVKGSHVEEPQELGATLDAAFAHDGPALIECTVDPFEPPHPPKATLEDALRVAKALSRGEPHAGRIALTLFRDKLDDLGREPARRRT
ncbi:MAG TPA: thiamine pyrophosphate-dependent enzyme [Candidatus Thermoplasmatota archaeon]|nr:thiamine pyrophosphate-dependent enzyme [Candidatus Thermoplasmatota archaeon]